jgi:hypothetical protein
VNVVSDTPTRMMSLLKNEWPKNSTEDHLTLESTVVVVAVLAKKSKTERKHNSHEVFSAILI